MASILSRPEYVNTQQIYIVKYNKQNSRFEVHSFITEFIYMTYLWQLFVPFNGISLCYSYYHLTAFRNQRTVDPRFARRIPTGSGMELTLYPKSFESGLEKKSHQADVLVKWTCFAKLLKMPIKGRPFQESYLSIKCISSFISMVIFASISNLLNIGWAIQYPFGKHCMSGGYGCPWNQSIDVPNDLTHFGMDTKFSRYHMNWTFHKIRKTPIIQKCNWINIAVVLYSESQERCRDERK